jgi:hypothetical protein
MVTEVLYVRNVDAAVGRPCPAGRQLRPPPSGKVNVGIRK